MSLSITPIPDDLRSDGRFMKFRWLFVGVADGQDVIVRTVGDSVFASVPCTAPCWESIPCPECGTALPPRGRSVPMEMWIGSCCERHRYDTENKRHLWSAKDSDRTFSWVPRPERWINRGHIARCGKRAA
jgi:hypothetical protein